jgi:O-antigen/teichoic acid export membrane protein
MAGALINVVLNFLLIPERGAMGAAVATAISYMAVYAIRAYDTRFYVKFNMHTVRMAVNTAVLILQTVIMISGVRYWRYIQLALVGFMLVFNGRDIFLAVVTFGKKMLKKEEKN